MSRAAGARIHRKLLASKRPQTFVPVDTFLVFGQSNASQAIPAPNLSTFSTSPDVAWGVTRSPQPDRGLVGPLANGEQLTPHFGQSHGWGHWAQEWYDRTGRRSVWANFAFAGVQLCAATNPLAERQWSVEDMSKSMVGDYVFGGDLYTRRQLIHHAFDAVDYTPRFKRGGRYVIWVQGEADTSTPDIENEYRTQLDALFTFCKSEWAIDGFFIIELGRKGTDAAAVASNEPNYIKVRNAQNAVSASRSDTFTVFQGCKEEGSPFDTLTVDGNGYWVSGWDYQADGVHYETASYYALGKTAAKNALTAIGLL